LLQSLHSKKKPSASANTARSKSSEKVQKWLRSSHAPNSAQANDSRLERTDRQSRKDIDNAAKKARIISGNQSDMKSEEVNRGHVTSGRTKSDVSKGHTEGERGRKLERPKSIIKSSNKENLKEPKGVNFKDDHKSDRYTNARKSIFVPASQSNLEDDEDNEEFETEKKTPSDVDNYLQADRKHSPEGQEETPIQSAFLTTESSSDQLKKSSSPPKTPPKTIHIHTHIPSVPSHTFDTDDTTGTECTKTLIFLPSPVTHSILMILPERSVQSLRK